MIRYTLRCDRDHEFEAWFASGAAYDRTAKAGANACPVCGSTAVEKAIMAPAIGAAGRDKGEAPKGDDTKGDETKGDAKMTLAAVDPRRRAFLDMVREFRKKVTENSDYVGERFPEEARKIHYEEAPVRSIYGEASPEEAQELAEEGIAFQPLPLLPDSGN